MQNFVVFHAFVFQKWSWTFIPDGIKRVLKVLTLTWCSLLYASFLYHRLHQSPDTHQVCDCGDTHQNRAWYASWHPAALEDATTLTLSSDNWHISFTWRWHSCSASPLTCTHTGYVSLYVSRTQAKHILYAPIDAPPHSINIHSWLP